MKYTITKRIGKDSHHFQVEGVNLWECLIEAEKLSFPNVKACGECGKEFLYLHAYVAGEKKYKYAKVVCASCGASVTFGQRSDDPDVFYLRKNENGDLDWKLPEKPPAKPRQQEDDDLPF